MNTPRQSIKLEEPQRQLLGGWVRAHSTPQQVAKRCQIILQSAEGKSDKAIAMELDINRHTCRLWRERFAASGVDCLWEVEAGRGRARARWLRCREFTPALWRESGRSTNSNLTDKRP